MDAQRQLLNPGDVIRFTVTGRLMTVDSIDPTGLRVTCIYYDADKFINNTYCYVHLLKVSPQVASSSEREDEGMSIRVGDSVRLKSGGPLMVAEHVDMAYGLVDCVWQDDKRPYRKTFGISTLAEVETASSEIATKDLSVSPRRQRKIEPPIPSDIQDSLKAFQADHPDPPKAAFIMVRFSETDPHSEIVRVIREATDKHGITAMRADQREYHDATFSNIKTYMHGCGFGIAVFERIETEEPNPNVGLEVGYMMALNKPVLLLKDRTVKTLQSDLAGKLYKPFDTTKPAATLPEVINKWLDDKKLAGL